MQHVMLDINLNLQLIMLQNILCQEMNQPYNIRKCYYKWNVIRQKNHTQCLNTNSHWYVSYTWIGIRHGMRRCAPARTRRPYPGSQYVSSPSHWTTEYYQILHMKTFFISTCHNKDMTVRQNCQLKVYCVIWEFILCASVLMMHWVWGNVGLAILVCV